MKIELGTYYTEDSDQHFGIVWQCYHCSSGKLSDIYPNRMRCDNRGLHRLEDEACSDVEVHVDAVDMLARIIQGLKSSLGGAEE